MKAMIVGWCGVLKKKKSKLSEPITEKSLSLILDNDLTAETWRYLQVKMAKGKFTDENFLNLLFEYNKKTESSGFSKHPRDEPEIKLEADTTMTAPVTTMLETDTIDVQGKIPRISTSNEGKHGLFFANLSQELGYLKNQTEEERNMMIQRFKGKFKESDYMDGFEADGVQEDMEAQTKRRRLDMEEWLNNPLYDKEDRLDLFPIQEMSPESSMGSFEVVQRARGPIPPPIP